MELSIETRAGFELEIPPALKDQHKTNAAFSRLWPLITAKVTCFPN